MKPSNEFCINFLKASGWLDNHDKQIRVDAENELLETDKYDELSQKIAIDILERGIRKGRADAIDEYKEQLLENLISMKDKYFDLVKGTEMPERYTHLKRMYTVNTIIEMVKIKAEQLKKLKGAENEWNRMG